MERISRDRLLRLGERAGVLTPGDGLLLNILTATEPLPQSPEEWTRAIESARRHGIPSYLYDFCTRGFDGADVPESTLEELRKYYRRALAANGALYLELAGALQALKDAGLPVIVLKGAWLAETVYRSCALRFMSDADILVRPGDLGRAQSILLAAGYPPHGKILALDVHGRLGAAYEQMEIDHDGLWRRAEPASVGGVDVLGLAPDDLLLHVCTHLSYQHLFAEAGFRGLVDIREIFRRRGSSISIETVLDRAPSWHNRGGVRLSLILARELAGADVPPLPGNGEGETFDDELLSWALGQIFSDDPEPERRAFSPYFWQLWKKAPLGEKIANLRRLLLPRKEFVAQRYPVSPRSPKAALYYLFRLGDNLTDYLQVTLGLLRGNGKLRSRADRINRGIEMRRHLSSRR